MVVNPLEIELVDCSGCLRETNQEVVFVARDDRSIYKRVTRCRGCNSVHLVTRYGRKNEKINDSILPRRTRQQPIWCADAMFGMLGSGLDEHISDLMDEIYEALSAGSTRLATMGIRALLEVVMIAKVGDQGTFLKSLEKFEQDGFVSRVQRDILAAALEVGHATIHRQHRPTSSDVSTLLDVAEGIVAALFVHPKESEKLADKLPPRNRPTKP